MPGEVSAESLRSAVESVLGEASFARSAGVIAEEIAAMPGPDEVADRLAAGA
jgi:UDP:flavonoid glycosyltransferase YjiC (YdhE family)